MINELIKLANALDNMGHRSQSDKIDYIIKSAAAWEEEGSDFASATGQGLDEWEEAVPIGAEDIGEDLSPSDSDLDLEDDEDIIDLEDPNFESGMSSYSAMVLREHNLSDEHYISSSGDPYAYVYIPSLRGREAFLVTEGPIDTRNYDAAGNAKKEIVIREGNEAAWDILKDHIPDEYKPDESGSGLQTASGSTWTLGGWTQFRNEDGTVHHYKDNMGHEKWFRNAEGKVQVKMGDLKWHWIATIGEHWTNTNWEPATQ